LSEEALENAYGFGLIQEITKMKSVSAQIKNEVRQETLDRLKLKELLFDFTTIIRTVPLYLKLISSNLQEKNELGFSREDAIKAYEKLAYGLTSYAQQIDNESSFPDSKIRNDIFQLLIGCTIEVNHFETYMLASDQAIGPFGKILEFIATKPLGLDEKWVAAACHLSAFDIMINKKREKLKIAKKPDDEKKIDFYTKFDEVVKVLESKKGELSKIVTQLPKVFWQIRVDVIHYGYVPTQEELDLIVKWSNEIMKVISE
jgi:hypothetical protein